MTHENLDGSSRREIRVPLPWQEEDSGLRDYTGMAWYRRSFELPQVTDMAEPRVAVLHFGAVDYHAAVWVDGEFVGEHEGGYLPFEFELRNAKPGTHEVVVRVADPASEADFAPELSFSDIPHGKQSWYGMQSGIWQSVWIEWRHAFYIQRLQITPDVANQKAEVTLELNRTVTSPLYALLTVHDPNQKTAQHCFTVDRDMTQVHFTVPIPDPMLWDTQDPKLYRLDAALTPAQDGVQPLDVTSSNFGMRTITTSADGHLNLNGRILFVRGALDQDYYPFTGYTPFSDKELEEQFAQAKHMGLNCLRTHIKITDPRYYDVADRMGMLIWTELPNWENLSPAAMRRARETLNGMVRRDWNHPSIIIWTIINEGWGVDLAVNNEHRAWLAETYAYLKSLDPHRLIVGNSPCFTNFHVVTDIEDFHNYYAMPDHFRQWQEWVETFAARPPWTFAHQYENIKSWREFTEDPWNPTPRTPAPEVQRRGSEPMVVSEFGNWGLPDVDKLYEGYKGEPWWFETGSDWGAGVVYPHGIQQRYKTFHLDKVFPTLRDLTLASQRMQFVALKYQIEQIRRHPSIVGYIITEFTDVHWEVNGLLDICRNPKVYYDQIAQVNSADAIVPTEAKGIVHEEGERCEVQLGFSHFSGTDLRGCRVEWNLDLWPNIRGTFENIQPQRGKLTPVGTVAFDVPKLERSVRARLVMRVIHGNTEVTCNDHEMYCFPRIGQQNELTLHVPESGVLSRSLAKLGYKVTDKIEGTDVTVVQEMNDFCRMYLQRGGHVLWLAETAESQQSHLGNILVKSRTGESWQGDWASSMSYIRPDRFSDIPTEGLVDFAFADLTPETVITGLRPRDFAADVFAGLFVGWVHNTVATIAERRIGSGRLLISTFRLSEHVSRNPVANIMIRDMLNHLTAHRESETKPEKTSAFAYAKV